MIAMRLPTGLWLGNDDSEFRAHDADAVGVDLQHLTDHGADQGLVSLPGGERMNGRGDGAADVDIDATGLGVGGGLVLGIEQRLEGRIGTAGFEACRDADAGEEPLPAQAIALRHQTGVVRLGEHLVDDGVVVAAVIGGAARNQIRKLLGADQVAPPHLQAIEPAMPGHLLERALDGVIGGRLAECAHCLLHRLVRRHRDGAVLHAPDAVRPDDRADGLAELEWRAPGVSADIVERAHLHRADHAGVIEGDLDIEVALGTVGVAGAHVLEPVLDQPHREAEPAGEVPDQHGVLDAALDSVAAAHVHVVVNAHGGARQLERERDLVGKARHLHRGEDVEHLAPGVPARHHGEGFDRHGRAAPPLYPQRQAMRAVGEILLDLTPDEGAIQQHVGAVIGMHERAAGRIGGFAVEHERQRLVIHAHQLGGVFGERARVRHRRRHPFS